MASRFAAGDGEVYIPDVVSGIYELWAIVQSRCLGLSGTNIHIIYIYTNVKRQHITITQVLH